VWQHVQGVAGFIIISLLQIFYRIWQWQNFENRLRFDRIIAMSLWRRFWPALWMKSTDCDRQHEEQKEEEQRHGVIGRAAFASSRWCWEMRWLIIAWRAVSKLSEYCSHICRRDSGVANWGQSEAVVPGRSRCKTASPKDSMTKKD